MYSKNIFFKFTFLFALLALCLHAEKLQAQNESGHFKYEWTMDLIFLVQI